MAGKIITDPAELADHIEHLLAPVDDAGYPTGMDDYHADEWKLIVDALRAKQALRDDDGGDT